MWMAVLASLASAAISNDASQRAAERQRRTAVEAQRRQLNAQNAATNVAAKKASEFDPTTRGEQQHAIEQQLTEQYDKAAQPQITAQGVQVGSTVAPGAGSDFATAKARETAKTQESMHALASLMGRIGSATQQRQKEAIGLGDTAGAIGRIQTGAGNIWQADQPGIEAAGSPDMFSQLAAAGIGAYGKSLAAGAGSGGAANGNTTGSFARMDRGQASWL